MRSLLLLLIFTVSSSAALAQRKDSFTKIFQFSLVPGIGSNGFHPGGYNNYFSLNLSSGYSGANYLVEVAAISNLNVNETRGLQFAGIANLTGANSFQGLRTKEIDRKIREGVEANLSGVQFSGVANVVLNNVFGGQTSAGINISKGALMGFQLGGISNTVYKFAFGFQLAGLYNSAVQSMDGVQVAGLFNFTEGGLRGVQLAVFNKAASMSGINNFPKANDPTGFQIGLINFAGRMNGFQFGLINYGKRMQGTQVGLINIFNDGKDPQTRDGTAIGLLNIGSAFYLSAYVNDIFLSNIEIGTGTVKNRRISGDGVEKQFMSSLIYASDAFLGGREQWAIGYGIKKLYFNRSTFPGMNRFRFISLGGDFLHINHQRKKFTKDLSLISRPTISVGSRLHPKNRNFFVFVSAVYNVYFTENEEALKTLIRDGKKHWPGFAAGVMIQ